MFIRASRNFVAQRSWRTTFGYSLAAAACVALFKSMDNFTLKHVITAPDSFIAVQAYLLIGAWIGAICSWVFAHPVGKKVDHHFDGFVYRNIKMHAWAACSGLLNCLSTFFFLLASRFWDPSLLIALGSMIILYTTVGDVLGKHLPPRYVLLPAGLAFLGAIVAPYGGSYSFNETWWEPLVLVALLSAGLAAMAEFVDQEGVRGRDALSFSSWRLLWLAIGATVLDFGICVFSRTTNLFTATLLHALQIWYYVIPNVVTTTAFVFVGQAFRLLAKKQRAVSIVVIVMSFQTIFGFAVTWLGTWLVPIIFGVLPFGPLPGDPFVWAARLIGAGLIIGSILLLRRYDSKQSA